MKQEIILINYTGQNGSGPLNAIEMTRGFIQNGQDVAAIVSRTVCNIEEWRKLKLVELIEIDTFYSIKDMLKASISFEQRYRKQISVLKEKYDIQFIYIPMMSLWSRKINNILRQIPVCVVNHDPIPHTGDKKTRLGNIFGMQRVYRDACVIVVHSKTFIEYVETMYNKQDRVLYVPLGPHRARVSDRDVITYDSSKVNFLFFGRIEDYKGLHILATAYRRLESECENTRLYIVGSGKFDKYQDEYSKLRSVTVINKWIPDEEVGNYFRGENLVSVLPYIDGTQSGPVIIALENQVPSIVTDTGGMAEQVIDGETGLVVKPGDADGLYVAMKKIVDSEQLRKQLVVGCEKLLSEIQWNLSAEKIAHMMSDIH